MKPRVAIACQGGGSQTAFTAGVLKALCEKHVLEKFDIVSISGTSGGALCGFMIWYAWKKREMPVWKRLYEFWADNSAKSAQERMLNKYVTNMTKWVGSGLLPQFNISPSSPVMKFSTKLATVGIRPEFTDLGLLLNTHADFGEIASWGAQAEPPILVLGACNVLTGRLQKFTSFVEPIRVEHILASACVPTIFPAVRIGDMAYWDGLFSDNPPIASLANPNVVGLKNIPNELWVIKINPTATDRIPAFAKDIGDRRNELAGNISLFHGLKQLEQINEFLLAGAYTEEFMTKVDVKSPIKIPKALPEDPDRPYHIPMIEISAEVGKNLNYESKLDRDPAHIKRLMQHGEEQGSKFLEARLSS